MIGYYVILLIFLLYAYKRLVKSSEKYYIITFLHEKSTTQVYRVNNDVFEWDNTGIYRNNVKISDIYFNPNYSLIISELIPASSNTNIKIHCAGKPKDLKQIRLKFKKRMCDLFKDKNDKDRFYGNDRNIEQYMGRYGYEYDCVMAKNLLNDVLIVDKFKIVYLNLKNLTITPVQRFCTFNNIDQNFNMILPDLVDFNLANIYLVSTYGQKRKLYKNKYYHTCVNYNKCNKCIITDLNNNVTYLHDIDVDKLYYLLLPF